MPSESIDEAVHSVIRDAVCKAMKGSNDSLDKASKKVSCAADNVDKAAKNLENAGDKIEEVSKKLQRRVFVAISLLWLFAVQHFFIAHDRFGWPLPWQGEWWPWRFQWPPDVEALIFTVVILEILAPIFILFIRPFRKIFG